VRHAHVGHDEITRHVVQGTRLGHAARRASDHQAQARPHFKLERPRRDQLRRHVLGGLGVGAAAALVGAAAGIEFFGLFTPGGIAANLILAPLAALVIVAGFLSLAAGLSGAMIISRFLNGAASVLLRAIIHLIRAGLRAPGVCVAARFRADWIGPAALAALLALCLAGYAGGWNRRRGGFWPPFVLIALALVFGAKFSLTFPR